MIAAKLPLVVQGFSPCAAAPRERTEKGWELAALSMLLAVMNYHLLRGGVPATWAFYPDRVAAGEWWRLLTHPFAHVSWYHLALDGAAFLILYAALGACSRAKRLGLVAATAAGSVFTAWLAAPQVATLGLCGLSGIAHGLMVWVTLEGMEARGERGSRTVAVVSFLILIAKCLYELLSGQPAFGNWHLGSIGTPIVVCHSGGVIGALGFWLLAGQKVPRRRRRLVSGEVHSAV